MQMAFFFGSGGKIDLPQIDKKAVFFYNVKLKKLCRNTCEFFHKKVRNGMKRRLLALLICLALALSLFSFAVFAEPDEGGGNADGEASAEQGQSGEGQGGHGETPEGGESAPGSESGTEGGEEEPGSGSGTEGGEEEPGSESGEIKIEDEDDPASKWPSHPGPDGDYEAYEIPRITEVDASVFEDLEYLENAEISFSEDRISFQRGTCLDLTKYISVSPDLSHCFWTSGDTGVLTVDEDGVARGMTIGSTYVTARVGTKEDHIYVEVTGNSMVREISEFPYKMYVNRSFNCVTVYQMDEKGDYSIPIRSFRCSTGLRTPIDDTQILNHNAWNGLADDSVGMWTSWIGGNFLFHSVSFFQRTHDSLKEEWYNILGTTCSGGCVRLQVLNAKWIYDNTPVYSPVFLEYNTETPGPFGLPEAIDTTGALGWDPTDPEPGNPWLNGEPEIIGVSDQWTPVGGTVSYFSGVKGVDSVGNDISDRVRVRTSVDSSKSGVYWVEYYLTDSSYETAHRYIRVTVGEG